MSYLHGTTQLALPTINNHLLPPGLAALACTGKTQSCLVKQGLVQSSLWFVQELIPSEHGTRMDTDFHGLVGP